MAHSWDIPPGTVTTRAVVAARFGGSTQGGIQPSTQSPNVMLYSDPTSGRVHGYNFDGWASDGSAFYYTGEGQLGDQRLVKGNRAVLQHLDHGRALRVFEAAGKSAGPGGKPQRYIGAFQVDPEAPYRREEAPDREGAGRSVLVFRLIAEAVQAQLPRITDANPRTTSTAHFIASENNVVREFPVSAREASTAERREAQLVAQLEGQLRAAGHSIGRLKLMPSGSSSVMWTDTFDTTTRRLYEAKGVSTRMAVRLAIGQLLDYRRFVDDVRGMTIVLPVRPAEDLVHLVQSCGMELLYTGETGLIREDAHSLEATL